MDELERAASAVCEYMVVNGPGMPSAAELVVILRQARLVAEAHGVDLEAGARLLVSTAFPIGRHPPPGLLSHA